MTRTRLRADVKPLVGQVSPQDHVRNHQRLHVGHLCCHARCPAPCRGVPVPSPGRAPTVHRHSARQPGARPVPPGRAGPALVPRARLRALPGPRRRRLPGHRLPLPPRRHRRPRREGPGPARGPGPLPTRGHAPRDPRRHADRVRPRCRSPRERQRPVVQQEAQGVRRQRAVPVRPRRHPAAGLRGRTRIHPDITAARIHALPALYKAAADGHPPSPTRATSAPASASSSRSGARRAAPSRPCTRTREPPTT